MNESDIRAGIDIGGTFTDLCLAQDGRIIATAKTLTTVDEPGRGVERVLRETLSDVGMAADDLEQIVHATTLVTNALIERKGAVTALLTTAGFRDVLEIGREQRYDLYDLELERLPPLVPRYLRFDVAERVYADGAVETALDDAFVSDLAAELSQRHVSALAISFLHSHINPEHERAAREAALAAAPGLTVVLSSEIVPEVGEYARTVTTVASAYVHSLVNSYLSDLRRRIDELGARCPLVVMLSNGGTAILETAAANPIRLLESGPAAGAVAASQFAARRGDVLSFDMGGTTAKICVVERGDPLLTNGLEVGRNAALKKGSGLPLVLPVIDMIEIGAGGGSVARIDSLGLLRIGPESAGSQPGPACYGRGGQQATVTDADLVLGHLSPESFLGGRMQLDLDAARQAIATDVAEPLGLSIEEAAWGIHELVEEQMANAARVHATERGKDAADLDLFAFGGAGPVHGVGVARRLGVRRVVVATAAGVMSAAGLLAAPLAFDFVRSRLMSLAATGWGEIDLLFAEMEYEGRQLLADADVPPEEITFRRFADLRHGGQGHEVRIAVPADVAEGWPEPLLAAFASEYATLFGRAVPAVSVEATAWRLIASAPRPSVALPRIPPASVETADAKQSRKVWFGDGYHDVPVYTRRSLVGGQALNGPAIVEERESALVVPAGHRLRIESDETLIVDIGAAP
jgi:N-methylhydantoinase A